MSRRNGQVLVEYILLSVMLLAATVFILHFIIKDVFGKPVLDGLRDKTTQCVSTLKTGGCK